jgi:hypothetical protein
MAVNINIPSQVRTFANLAAFPATGAVKTIYIAEDTNKTYRWTGSVYVEISGADFSGYVPTSRTLTINGVAQDLSADRSWTISTGLTVGTTPISSGTIGRVLFQGAGNVLQQSSSLFWDSTNNRLGIGTSSPAEALDVVGILKGTTSAAGSMFSLAGVNNTSLSVANDSSGRAFIEVKGNTAATIAAGAYFTADGYQESWFNVTARQASTDNKRWRFGNLGGNNYFAIQKLNDAGTAILSTALTAFSSTSNIGINTTTDAGFRLDVNGTARINTLTIGLGAGQVSTNTALGNVALNANTTGASNTAVGYFAMNNNRGGTNNTAVGLQSLLDNQNGNANTAIGRNALLNTSGSNNTAIGFQAGSVGVPNTTGENNIFIGYQATGVSASQSNRTWIGNSSTTSTWLAGNVLIGTTTDAGFRLDVNGTVRSNNTITGNNLVSVANILCGNILYGNGANSFWISATGNATFGNANNPVASAKVEIISTTQGFLPPRMTTTQKNAIASPATGLQVYDTTLNQMSYYNGTTWTNI